MKALSGLLLLFVSTFAFSQSVLLPGGKYGVFQVSEEGVYKITFDDVARLGLNPASVDPSALHVFTGSGGVLPQANSEATDFRTRQIPVASYGLEDGQFQEEDYLLAYIPGPDKVFSTEGEIRVAQNFYSRTTNFYLAFDPSLPPLRIPSERPLPGGPVIQTYKAIQHHEHDIINLLKSGRDWVGEEFAEDGSLDFSFLLHETNDVELNARFVSRALRQGTFTLFCNGQEVGKTTAYPIQQSIWGIKAQPADIDITIPAGITRTGQNTLTFRFDQAPISTAYLDYFELSFARKPDPDRPNLMRFAGNYPSAFRFEPGEAFAGHQLWNVTDPLRPARQDFERYVAGNKSRTYMLFKPQLALEAQFHSIQVVPELPTGPADLLIVTPGAWRHEAERLATFRREHDGLSVHVAEVEYIYARYASGRRDISAIRNYARDLNTSGKLRYLLIFADGSYDVAGIYDDNIHAIPAYPSTESFHDVLSYASDDYFGFFDEQEGEWTEGGSRQTIHDLDIAVGRLPVASAEEATAMVNKLITYASAEEGFGPWRNRIAFVADDGDYNKHMLRSDILASEMESSQPQIVTDRLFVDAYPQVRDPSWPVKISPAARAELSRAVDHGSFIIDYIGHGGETGWTDERILTIDQMKKWQNSASFPIILSPTCEFGRFDDFGRRSAAEEALLLPHSGAIALLTTTRPVFSATNFELSYAFYEALYKEDNGERLRLGDLFRQTKNAAIRGVINRNFSLLGDPSMMPAYPKGKLRLTAITGHDGEPLDTLSGGQTVTFEGEVIFEETIAEAFNGQVFLSLFDEAVEKETLGEGGPHTRITYHEYDDLIYQGKATITNGKFSIEISLPSRTQDFTELRLSLYARESGEDGRVIRDAAGGMSNLAMSQGAIQDVDRSAPLITMYLDHPYFSEGDPVSADAVLIAQLSDPGGISLGSGPQKGLWAVLDTLTQQPFQLNRYFYYNENDATRGSLTCPLYGMEPGQHTLTLYAGDYSGNRTSKQIRFEVVENNRTFLQEVVAFPNPATDHVDFQFFLSNPVEDYQIELIVFDQLGKILFREERQFINPTEKNHSLRWNIPFVNAGTQTYQMVYYHLQLKSLEGLSRTFEKRGKVLLYR
ncbi:type IX secretion system sortase PorU [Roseivirga sp. BDSF3-8]|uniref:type IX secretion system sortase PorU n=1 Tax=Roseivirga sp. BDSF3-8 TaxID=3241598 RepID=UPI0035327851